MAKNLSDRELFSRIKKKEDIYYFQLLIRYQRKFNIILRKVSQLMNIYRYCEDDFLLIFYQSFEAAYNSFSKEKASFSAYFNVIAERRIKKEFIKIINSDDALDKSISLDTLIDEDLTLLDVVTDENEISPLSASCCEDIKLTLRSTSKDKTVDKKLRLVAQALLLRMEGYSVNEVAEKLKLSVSQVRRLYNAKHAETLKNKIIKFK